MRIANSLLVQYLQEWLGNLGGFAAVIRGGDRVLEVELVPVRGIRNRLVFLTGFDRDVRSAQLEHSR